MALKAAAGAVSPAVRLKALALIKALPPKDFIGELVTLNAFVRDKIRYTRDVWMVETLQDPAATMELGQGDCDDKATLLASLLMSIGFKVEFGLLKRKGVIVHVWTRAFVNGIPIDCETTENVPCGQLPPLPAGDSKEFYQVKPYDIVRR